MPSAGRKSSKLPASPQSDLASERVGAHVVKALALGEKAVLIGRATLYGAAAAGEPGALEILREEFVRTMQLCGVRNVAEIGPELIDP